MKKGLIEFFVFGFIIFIGISSAINWDNVAYWSLDETSGSARDLTDNGNDGIIFGGPIQGAEGKIGKAINFNYSRGNDNYVNTTDIDLNGSASYSLWVVLKEGEDETTFLSKRDRWGGTTIEIYSANGVRFCIRTVSENSKKGWTWFKHFLNTLSRIFFGRDLKNYTFWGLTELEQSCVSSEAAPYFNDWFHIVSVYDEPNKKMSLYINGQYNSSTIHETGLPLNNKNYVIGANAMGADGYDGGKYGSEGAKERIDEVGIWNRVLSEYEIAELYNNEKGKAYLS